MNSPAEHPQHKVEHEKGADHNKREEVGPIEVSTHSVVRLYDELKV